MKTLQKLSVLFLSIVIFISCKQKNMLVAQIEGLGNDTILVEYAPISQMHNIDDFLTDTIIAKDNKFEYTPSITEPIMAYFFPKNAAFKRLNGHPFHPQQKHLVLKLKPDDKLSVKGRLHDYYLEYYTNGSDFNKDFCEVRSKHIKNSSNAVQIELLIDSLKNSNEDKAIINELFEKRRAFDKLAGKEELKYIKSNFDKELSAYYLCRQNLDTLMKYHANLNDKIANGSFKNTLDGQVLRFKKYTLIQDAEKNITKGKTAPNFVLKSIKGDDFELNSVKNKYVVLDFWGSWCGWCIKGFPKMKEYYSKYQSKVEFIGIDCNETEEKWKTSVADNGLKWTQVINAESIEKDASVMYAIKGYPTKIILDKDKRIVDVYKGETEDFYNKLDELLK
ncbi:thioredoxin-like domain-containing protein [Marinifilum fragile]|uniref:thioredoxin-like domain-containing protein n=1 Tax=Marinifilum fragile TaxID=570161 RepID=UPI002AA6BD0D|nr:thioredoxin-like domain-containing protein [Marinifilum fragile]